MGTNCYNINGITLTTRMKNIKLEETNCTKSNKLIASPTQKNNINSRFDHLSVLNWKDDNTLSRSPLKHSDAIKRTVNKHLPIPFKDSKCNFISHWTHWSKLPEKIKLTDATSQTKTKISYTNYVMIIQTSSQNTPLTLEIFGNINLVQMTLRFKITLKL